MADRQGEELRLRDVDNDSSALVAEAADGALDKPTVRQTVWRVTKGMVPVVTIYALGFWRVASVSAWVLVPFFFCLSVVRDLLRDAGRTKRRRAQLAAAADEKDLITANVAELPSWVFFPDIHRAEWLNQVGRLFLTSILEVDGQCLLIAYLGLFRFRSSSRCGR